MWAAALALVILAPGTAAEQPADPNGTADGAQLYATGCASCHGAFGEGTPDAPSLVGVGDAAVDFMLRTGRMPAAFPQQQAAIAGTPKYTDAERARIVAHVRTLGTVQAEGAAIPDVDPARGDLQTGRELFLSNCAACHGIGASGDAVGEKAVAPSLHGLDPVVVGEAPLVGPGVMPKFDDVLGPGDLDSIAAYLQTTGAQAGPAGLTLDDQGPLMEGLVAGLVGLGALILVARVVEGSSRARSPGRRRPSGGSTGAGVAP